MTLAAGTLTTIKGAIETPGWSRLFPGIPVEATRAFGAANNAFFATILHRVAGYSAFGAGLGHSILFAHDVSAPVPNYPGAVFNFAAAGSKFYVMYTGSTPAALLVGGFLLFDAGLTATGVKEHYDQPWAIYSLFAGMHRVD
ncbi:MAG: hypothetical protein Q8N51_19150 [Gammaproteobacteria bacterium]|nr:hypothetical protein [Gammaproteobacteria bacterium]